MKQPNYKFYPSLLDKFYKYMNLDYENFFYKDDSGKWHKNLNDESGECALSSEEVEAIAKQELIDSINRVKSEPSEAAAKGTCYNELVDALIHNKKSENQNLSTSKIFNSDNTCVAIGCVLDGFSFQFDLPFIQGAAEYFKGSQSQVYCEAPIETDYGTVMLYGYIDELRQDVVYDIKTTKQYSFGNYENYWQRHLYPYCLIESGDCTDIRAFEFTVFQLKGGTSRTPYITGSMYREEYTYDHKTSTAMLKQICERLIEFLNNNRSLITDKKVFGGEKDN